MRNRVRTRILTIALMGLLCAAAPGQGWAGISTAPGIAADEAAVIAAMAERSRVAARDFQEYRVTRIFQAENPRFKKRASMVVETRVDAKRHTESRLISFEGSELIRRRVFEKILEAEAEAEGRRDDVDLTPENYKFKFLKVEDWKGRPSYVFAITPLRKNKYAVQGSIWLDCEDLRIARVVGSPLIRPSFWTTSARIEKEYHKQGTGGFPPGFFRKARSSSPAGPLWRSTTSTRRRNNHEVTAKISTDCILPAP